MVINGTTPYKCITIRIGFDLCAIDIENFQGNKSLFFQEAQKLVVQVIQYVPGQLFALKIVKGIPPGFLGCTRFSLSLNTGQEAL